MRPPEGLWFFLQGSTAMETLTKKFAAPALTLRKAVVGQPVALAAAQVGNEYLDMDIVQLMNITVTSAAKKEQRLSDATAAVFVITQEDIRRSGVTTIPDALAMAPGLQVAKSSTSKWSVSSRGFAGSTSNKLLVLIDGRSACSPAYSGTLWDMNAVNGVINIIARKARDTQGDQEPIMASAHCGGKINDTTFGWFYLTTSTHGSDADAEDGWWNGQGGFRLDDGCQGQGRKWTLQGDLYQNGGDQLVSPSWISQPPFRLTLEDGIDSSGDNILGRYRQEIGSDSVLTFKAYYDYSDHDEAILKMRFDTVDLDFRYETRLGRRQNLIMGSGYRSVDGDFDQTIQVTLPDRTDDLCSAFLQDETALPADRVWLTLGSKDEHNDFSGGEWQPGVRLLWKLAERHSFWATEALSPDLAVFYDDCDEIYTAVPTPSPAGFDYRFVNALSSYGQGIEVAADWKATSWLSFALSYPSLDLDWKDERDLLDNVGGPLLNEASPKHQLLLRSTIALAEHWQLYLWLGSIGSIKGLNRADLRSELVTLDTYFLVDANLIWTPRKDIEEMLAGQNLTSDGQLEYLSEHSTPPTEIDRGVYGKVTWRS